MKRSITISYSALVEAGLVELDAGECIDRIVPTIQNPRGFQVVIEDRPTKDGWLKEMGFDVA